MWKPGCVGLVLMVCLMTSPAWAEEEGETSDVALISKVLVNLNGRVSALEKQAGLPRSKTTPALSGIGSNISAQIQQLHNDVMTLNKRLNGLEEQFSITQNRLMTLENKIHSLEPQ